jgi:hypothetical protein
MRIKQCWSNDHGLFSHIRDKLILGDKLDRLPQYAEDVKHYLRLLSPENEWIKDFTAPPAVELLKQGLSNNGTPRQTALALLATRYGVYNQEGPFERNALYAADYVIWRSLLAKAEEES